MLTFYCPFVFSCAGQVVTLFILDLGSGKYCVVWLGPDWHHQVEKVRLNNLKVSRVSVKVNIDVAVCLVKLKAVT
jgi:hypothetical protein